MAMTIYRTRQDLPAAGKDGHLESPHQINVLDETKGKEELKDLNAFKVKKEPEFPRNENVGTYRRNF